MIFVLSTGRSGTKTLAAYLDEIPGVRAVHEPDPLFAESGAYLRGEMSLEEVEAHLRRTRHEPEGALYAESCQTLAAVVPALREAFPEAAYVWLLRDGREVVASWLRWSGDLYADDGSPWHRFRIRPRGSGEMTDRAWDALDTFEKTCWYWTFTNATIARDLEGVPRSRQVLVRLETVDSDIQSLSRLGLALPGHRSVPRKNQSLQRGARRWQSWTPEQRSAFERICGEMMDRYYPAWRGPDGRWRVLEARGVKERVRDVLRHFVYQQRFTRRIASHIGRRWLPARWKTRARRWLGFE